MFTFLASMRERHQDLLPERERHQELLPELPLECQHVIFQQSHGLTLRNLSRALCSLHDSLCQRLSFACQCPTDVIRSRVAACPALTTVTVAAPCSLSDELCEFLLQRPHLCSLDVSFCSGLTDRTLLLFCASQIQWRAEACFLEPSPALSATQVLRTQLLVLRMGADDGIARCFAFASPDNRRQTGPLPRFARMIREGYGVMLQWRKAYVAEHHIAHDGTLEADQAIFIVTLIGPDDTPTAFIWHLEVQGAATGYEGCWMTAAVGGLPVHEVLDAHMHPKGEQLPEPPWRAPQWPGAER